MSPKSTNSWPSAISLRPISRLPPTSKPNSSTPSWPRFEAKFVGCVSASVTHRFSQRDEIRRSRRSHYQQALDIFIEFNDRYSQADTYQGLGIVAEDLREYEHARSYYQQALDIQIEFGDRYSQASTYNQLGFLSEAQEDYAQAQQHLQQALIIFAEFNDQHSVAQTIQILAHLYQTTQDDRLLVTVAQCLGFTPAEVQQLFAAASP
ncbi:MAG: hypothetical protein DCF17_08770 [Shackletoniella antarctica]|uniref:Uncharacterized protein n=1 Tax=Shackletoniella antarctica TaxID=268115 RepID=A0A2W4YHG6_9CYAN|nr:MAG: hypothetical protein DCF17_08770 [Shackletoniella antarctica]